MRRSSLRSFSQSHAVCYPRASKFLQPAVVQIVDATFHRQHPSLPAESNPPLFPHLHFTLPAFSPKPQHWSIIGPSLAGKTTFLQILRGQYLCSPPDARTYPYLSTEQIVRKDPRRQSPTHAIQYVGFADERGGPRGSATKAAYLSARYESRREEVDHSLRDYLLGETSLNALDGPAHPSRDHEHLGVVAKDLRLQQLLDFPVGNLSNGQSRRARIARALLRKPELLLLDEPFMGLDPPTLASLSPLLHQLAAAHAPRLVLALRPQDPIPDWISHVLWLGPDLTVAYQGRKRDVLRDVRLSVRAETAGDADTPRALVKSVHEIGRILTADGILEAKSPSEYSAKTRAPRAPTPVHQVGEVLVEMEGVQVAYGDRKVLGDWEEAVDGQLRRGLWFSVRRGDRWAIVGPNGSGKTTILSLICSDHPQAYSLPIRHFGRSRLPTPGSPGISIFDIQARIGHSSPEVHAFFPRDLSVRQTIENAWADTFRGRARLSHDRDRAVDACLSWFHRELNPAFLPAHEGVDAPSQGSETHLKGALARWRRLHLVTSPPCDDEPPEHDWADDLRFGELSFSAQRLALFLRAIVKKPEIVILDEAFSGMDDGLRDKCMLFLEHGESRRFRYEGATSRKAGRQGIVETTRSRQGQVRIDGLSDEQALLCVSHVREEVPGVVRDWLCLPDAHEGTPARFGRLDRPLSQDREQWKEIWGL